MRQTRAVVLGLLLSSTLVAGQQSQQLTVVPPKPTCTLIFKTGSCADLWTNYNQAFAQRQREEIQLYVNRQKELASEAATAPLQQQISELTRLTGDQQTQISKLQQQMQSDASASVEARQNAHQQGLWEGLVIGGAGVLILMAVVWGARRISRSFTITKKEAVE
ncbi:MAG TPA: hypothetical protein VOA78_08465 [Candidatus Dormibacteraeota bacterium]|nr:hypothetical protein [Candidatus Dormibacteraeota bacterium]